MPNQISLVQHIMGQALFYDESAICGVGVTGTKCRAPHSHAWGGMTYHNAMVIAVEPLEEEKQPTVGQQTLALCALFTLFAIRFGRIVKLVSVLNEHFHQIATKCALTKLLKCSQAPKPWRYLTYRFV